MDRLDQLLNDFLSDVERAKHLLTLITTFRKFGGSKIPPEVEDENPAWPEAVALWRDSKERRTDLPWLSGSLLLYLAGRLEYFARQIVETVAEDMADGVTNYSQVPDALRSELRSRTLEVVQNLARYGYDDGQAESFLLTLSDNLKGEAGWSISASVLSVTDSNLKDRVLAELLKRVGIKDFWREVGKQAKLKRELQTTTDQETTAKARSQLNALMDERNQIAHPTSSTHFPDPDKVMTTATFIEVFGSVATDVVRVQLSDFLNNIDTS